MTYKELVDSGRVDEKLKTKPNEARFWTGTTGDNYGEDNAERLANQDGGKTLEMKLADAGVDKEAQLGMTEAEWDDASERFVNGASGDVKCYKGEIDHKTEKPYNDQTDSVYNNTEKDKIEGNKDVNSITEVDNVNGTEVKGTYSINPNSGRLEDAHGNAYNGSASHKSRSLHNDLNNPNLFTENKSGDYTYAETQYGKHAEGNLTLAKGNRDVAAQREAGGEDRRATDDGGHLIGNRFDGSGGTENLDAQDSNINRGSYKQLENREAAQLQSGDQVFTNKDTFKSNDSERPNAYMGYDITEHPDGTRDWDAYSYQNESAATQEAWNNESAEAFDKMADEYPNPMSEDIDKGEGEAPEEGQDQASEEGEGEESDESEGEEPTEGEGEEPAEGEGEKPAEGEGEKPTESEGEAPAKGEGEAPAESEDEEPAESEEEEPTEGEEPAEGEGEGSAEDESEEPAESEGEAPAEGKGEGEGSAKDEGEEPTEGEGEEPTEGEGEEPTEGEGEEPTEGEDEEPAEGEGEESAESEGKEPAEGDDIEKEQETSDNMEQEPEPNDAPEPEPESNDAPEPEPESNDAPEPEPSGGESNGGGPSNDSGPSQ